MIDPTATMPGNQAGRPGLTSAPSAEGRQTAVLASDFDTFLQMLTAQARYQDPLEPIDATEYAAQLAQFSMVEQQVQTNKTLNRLLGEFGASSIAELSGWVGMEARAVSPVYFDGTPITVSPEPDPSADEVQLVVKDAGGEIVQRFSIPVSTAAFQWDGLQSNGRAVANGVYSFTVESLKAGELVRSEPAAAYGRIIEAQFEAGQILLVLEGGQEIPSSAVTALRLEH